MKLNLSAITSPLLIDNNTVSGIIAGLPCTVSRRLNGWNPMICVVINDSVVHDNTASHDDRKEFNTLYDATFDARSAMAELKKSENSEAVKALYSIA